MSTFDVRVLDDEDELIAALNVFRTAMVGFPRLTGLQPGRIRTVLEPGRTLGAFADGRLVGTTDSASSTLTLPGGAHVGHAAVTHVGVLPTFTRRGIATGLLTHQLRRIREQGEAVATLRASEATIYGRFGYGVASSSAGFEVQTRRARLRPGVAGGGPVRLLDGDAAWDLLAQIYADNRPSRPGSIDRPRFWWQSQRLRAETATGPSYVAVHGDPGAENGFVRYRPADTEAWFVSDQRTVVVDDLFAPSADAYVGLLRFLLDLDLIDRLILPMRPVDDPLPLLLSDRRAVRITGIRDETWLRVVDVAAALTARGYAGDGDITLGIDDPALPENAGTFRITPEGAEPSGAPAQLVAGVEALGAALLGGTPWRGLALAGLVRVEDSDALSTADRLFAVPALPHAGFFF